MIEIKCYKCGKVIAIEENVKLKDETFDVKRDYKEPCRYDEDRQEFICLDCASSENIIGLTIPVPYR